MNDKARPVPPRLFIQSATCTDRSYPLDRNQVFDVCPNCASAQHVTARRGVTFFVARISGGDSRGTPDPSEREGSRRAGATPG
jgi:hypothetical protein